MAVPAVAMLLLLTAEQTLAACKGGRWKGRHKTIDARLRLPKSGDAQNIPRGRFYLSPLHSPRVGKLCVCRKTTQCSLIRCCKGVLRRVGKGWFQNII